MALTLPLSLVQFPGYFTDLNGQPLAGGLLQFYQAGTTTPGDVFADNQGVGSLVNPVVLDDSGFAAIFLSNAYLYDVVVSDADSVELYTREGVGNPAQITVASFGTISTQGAKLVSSGYTILSTDNLVTSTTGGTINLPAAAQRVAGVNTSGLALTIKNMSASTLSVVPAGADNIESLAAPYVIPAAASPLFPTITLASTGSSDWWITGGIGL